MTDPLVDADARARVAGALRVRMAVDAGAGSGKTTSLIERVVGLVAAEGVPMSAVAAITFTEAAAAELRTRIRGTLADRGRSDPRLAAAAREADDAAICTIHAFALRLLSEHWLEAGLPPGVEVLDSASQHVDERERWRRYSAELLGDTEAVDTLLLGFSMGLRMGQLPPIARALSEHHDRLDGPVLDALAEERRLAARTTVDVARLLAPLERALTFEPFCRDDDDGLLVHLREVVAPARRRLLAVADADTPTVLGVLGGLARLRTNAGKAGNWSVDVDDVRDACRDAETMRSETLERMRTSVAADLLWRIACFVVESAGARRMAGRLTYHDLLVEATRLIEQHPSVRRSVRERYRCLLIDEFQDTDPLQAKLAHLLADEEPGGEGPARLFVVGDPAQSIYRFRRADVAQFDAMVGALDERVELTANFRSVPEVLSFVDALFGGLGPHLQGDGAVAHHRALRAVRDRGDDAVGPAVGFFGEPDDQSLAREVRLRATAEVAAMLREVVDGWTVEDEGTARRARFRDIAVLLPTRTSLPLLERAFEAAGVPYRLEGATLIWGTQDIRDLLAVLRAVADPGDELAVVGALRTPALACGDDDLVRHHREGRGWDPRGAGGEIDGPVGVAFRVLASLHERAMWTETSTLMGEVLSELHFYELALVHPRPRDHWNRLRWVLDQSRAFDEARGGTLSDFLDWVDLTEEADRWSSAVGPPDADDNAVRVMTVHGAKGLEFPVVLLTGLDSPPLNFRPLLVFDESGLPRVRFGEFSSPEHERLAKRELDLDELERYRLLYVGLTRARDHLIVDLHHKQNATKALASKLHPISAGGLEGATRLFPAPATPGQAGPAPWDAGAQGDPRSWWAEQEAWTARRRERLAASALEPAWSATALSEKGGRETATGHAGPRRDALDPEVQRRIGRAAHDALAKITLPVSGVPSEEDREVARTSARAQHLVGTQLDAVVALVRSAVGSPTIRSLAARRHWKELPLAAPLPEGGVLEGFADLVGEEDDGLVVVDFKTSTGRSAASQYMAQVALYAYALRAATGRTVTKIAVLYLTETGVEEDARTGAALTETVSAVLASVAATV